MPGRLEEQICVIAFTNSEAGSAPSRRGCSGRNQVGRSRSQSESEGDIDALIEADVTDGASSTSGLAKPRLLGDVLFNNMDQPGDIDSSLVRPRCS